MVEFHLQLMDYVECIQTQHIIRLLFWASFVRHFIKSYRIFFILSQYFIHLISLLNLLPTCRAMSIPKLAYVWFLITFPIIL